MSSATPSNISHTTSLITTSVHSTQAPSKTGQLTGHDVDLLVNKIDKTLQSIDNTVKTALTNFLNDCDTKKLDSTLKFEQLILSNLQGGLKRRLDLPKEKRERLLETINRINNKIEQVIPKANHQLDTLTVTPDTTPKLSRPPRQTTPKSSPVSTQSAIPANKPTKENIDASLKEITTKIIKITNLSGERKAAEITSTKLDLYFLEEELTELPADLTEQLKGEIDKLSEELNKLETSSKPTTSASNKKTPSNTTEQRKSPQASLKSPPHSLSESQPRLERRNANLNLSKQRSKSEPTISKPSKGSEEPAKTDRNSYFNRIKGSMKEVSFESFQAAIKEAADNNQELYYINGKIQTGSKSKVDKDAVKIPLMVLCRIGSRLSKEYPLPKELINNLNKLNDGFYKRFDEAQAVLVTKEFNSTIEHINLRKNADLMIKGGTERNTIACKCLDTIAKLMRNKQIGARVCGLMDCQLDAHMKATAGQHSRRVNLIKLKDSPSKDNYTKYMEDVGKASNTAAAADHIVRCLDKMNKAIETKCGKKYKESTLYQAFHQIMDPLKDLISPERMPSNDDVENVVELLSKLDTLVKDNIYNLSTVTK